jgi:HK97 family phage major capsid protein
MNRELTAELTRLIQDQDKAWHSFEAAANAREQKLLDRIEMLEAKSKVPGVVGMPNNSIERKFGERLRERKSLTTADANGSMVPIEIANAIMVKAIARSPLAKLVRLENVSTGDFKLPLSIGGTGSGWVGETDTRSETDTPSMRERAPTHGELYAYPKASEWLVDDSVFNIGAFVTNQVVNAFAKQLEDAILFGNGTSKPTGIFNSTPTEVADDGSPTRVRPA